MRTSTPVMPQTEKLFQRLQRKKVLTYFYTGDSISDLDPARSLFAVGAVGAVGAAGTVGAVGLVGANRLFILRVEPYL